MEYGGQNQPYPIIRMMSNDGNHGDLQEKEIDLYFMKEFRVFPCQLFLKFGKCPYSMPYTCDGWHKLHQRRRSPFHITGTINYSSETYCPFYNRKSGICRNGDECPFLHFIYGDMERKFHPMVYKTSRCSHMTDEEGVCASKFGYFCSYAHGLEDVRINQRFIDKWDFPSFVHQHYKVHPCSNAKCLGGWQCPFFHGYMDRRRPPESGYGKQSCVHARVGSKWLSYFDCKNGLNCPFCHNSFEQKYHEQVFRTESCDKWRKTGHCIRGRFCSYIHLKTVLELQEPLDILYRTPELSYSVYSNPNRPEPNSNVYSSSDQNQTDLETPKVSEHRHKPDSLPLLIKASLNSICATFDSAWNDRGLGLRSPPITQSIEIRKLDERLDKTRCEFLTKYDSFLNLSFSRLPILSKNSSPDSGTESPTTSSSGKCIVCGRGLSHPDDEILCSICKD